MGHLAGKDIYQKLGKKIDNLTVRVPWNETFYQILKELYSPQEADVVAKMPYTLSSLQRISRITGFAQTELKQILERLSSKGLVMDFWIRDGYHYMPSPIVVGIFEFTMMRTGNDLDTKKVARLFHEYMVEDGALYQANCGKGEKVSFIRTLPHEDTVRESDYVEVLDYEKAASIIQGSKKFSIGTCSCRHSMMHAEEKKCEVPLSKCSSFGSAAEFMIRHNFAREVTKSEMLENLAHSKEAGLVLNADNVRKNVTFICHCCSCCCHTLLGVSKFGYPNVVVTSNFIAETEESLCKGCGICAKACPINAREMVPLQNPKTKKKKSPVLDDDLCIGCGVCALRCKPGALKLVKRGQRVLHPETTFERVMLQCLEKGTLQNQIFDNPQSSTQKFMRGFVGGFLRLPPVKKSLMSDSLRSTFLNNMKQGVAKKGKGWLAEM
jgi:ferredoxin